MIEPIYKIILNKRNSLRNKFIAGTNVWLKSGSPKMTIGHLGYKSNPPPSESQWLYENGDYVICYWEIYSPYRGYSSGIFRKETLTFTKTEN